MLTLYDHAAVALYFAFMVLIGFAFRSFVKNTSDYFRGGGRMFWWMTGSSAFMTTFSAWTFTGAASSAYLNGPLVLVIFMGNVAGYLVNYFFFAARFRQLRIITPIQAMRDRFGPVSEQFFTWAYVPTNVLQGGIWLGGLSIFCSAVFGINLEVTILVTGAVVLLVSLLGGSWAVVASDFMQVLVLLPISIVLAVYALVEIGGPSELIARFPADSLLGNDIHYSTIVAFWICAVLVQKLLTTNNLIDSYRYLTARDTANARKGALLAATLFLVGPIIWFIPPMVAAVRHPDLASEFPQLGNRTSEAAYVVMGMDLLPMGMIGVLVAAIFAATMSSMDSGLNRNAGILIKNFYQPIFRPKAGDGELLFAGKAVTVLLGALIILAAIWQVRFKTLGLFDVLLQFVALIGIPLNVPFFWGAVIKRTPDWSGWSTTVLGFCLSLVLKLFFDASWLDGFLDLDPPLSIRESNDYLFIVAVFVNTLIPSLWFLGSRFFYREPTGQRKEDVDRMFHNMRTPVVVEDAEVKGTDVSQSRLLGRFSMAYGLFLCAFALIPNNMAGRIAFLFCGGLLVAIGLALRLASRRALRRNDSVDNRSAD
jgi:Na+/proline symporter